MVELVCSDCDFNCFLQAQMKDHIVDTGHGISIGDDPKTDEPYVFVRTPIRIAKRDWRRIIKAKRKARKDRQANPRVDPGDEHGHGDDEECIICPKCGHCHESGDDNDVCAYCRARSKRRRKRR